MSFYWPLVVEWSFVFEAAVSVRMCMCMCMRVCVSRQAGAGCRESSPLRTLRGLAPAGFHP